MYEIYPADEEAREVGAPLFRAGENGQLLGEAPPGLAVNCWVTMWREGAGFLGSGHERPVWVHPGEEDWLEALCQSMLRYADCYVVHEAEEVMASPGLVDRVLAWLGRARP